MAYTARQQQLAQAAIDKYGLPRLMIAAASIMVHQAGKEAGVFTKGEIIAFFESLHEKGITGLCRVADTIGEDEHPLIPPCHHKN